MSGSKNAALPQFAASLLTEEETILENVPDLSDINFMAEILTELGAEVNKLDKIHGRFVRPQLCTVLLMIWFGK